MDARKRTNEEFENFTKVAAGRFTSMKSPKHDGLSHTYASGFGIKQQQ